MSVGLAPLERQSAAHQLRQADVSRTAGDSWPQLGHWPLSPPAGPAVRQSPFWKLNFLLSRSPAVSCHVEYSQWNCHQYAMIL